MKRNQAQTFLLLSLFLVSHFAFSQNFDVNFEFQAYPTGLMPGLRLEKGFDQKNALHLRLGYNWVRHRDLGVHQDERGDGWGFTLGYKRFLKTDYSGWFLGIRNDVWFNTIDWKDQIGLEDEIGGQTQITVIQPTAELGYIVGIAPSWIFTPTLAFGYEVNVKTEGADVGEGAILLLGFSFGRRF